MARHLPWAILLGALLLNACESKQPSGAPVREPVVVYAHGSPDDARLEPLFAAFTRASGIPVTVRYGESGALTEDVIADRGAPPADVLLTSNVADVWRAADRGALRPIAAASLERVTPATRDPDGLWAAFDAYYASVGVARRIARPQFSSYEHLAESKLRGEMCLSSSTLPVNRAVIATLIAKMGAQEAERVVRGWVRNLALPPFDTEEQLIAALRSGQCGYGIFSDTIETGKLRRHDPSNRYYNVEGLGIARHARYPDSAQVLVEWMLAQDRRPSGNGEALDVGTVGWLDEDARRLAERAGYR